MQSNEKKIIIFAAGTGGHIYPAIPIAKELIKFKSALLNIYPKKLPILNYKKQELKEKFNIKIDYLELRNENDLKMSGINKKKRLFIAYHVNKVRLIDNF